MARNDDAVLTPDPNPVAGELSPTTIIMNAIRAQGKPITNANIRRYLEANARVQDDPTSGLGPLMTGKTPLVNNAPSTEAEDQAAMRGRGGGTSVAGKIEGNAPPDRTPARDTAQTTSAQPDAGLSPDYYLGATGNEAPSGIAAMILGGVPAAGAGAYGLSRLRNWGLGTGAPAMPDVGDGIHTSLVPRPGEPGGNPGEVDYTQLDPGRGSAMAEAPPSPMTQAMNAAMAPANSNLPTVGEGVPPMPDIGPVPQPRFSGPGSAVLPPDLGAVAPQTIPSGPVTQTLPANMPENAPRLPMPNRVNAPPTPADFYHPSWRTLGPLARSILGHVK